MTFIRIWLYGSGSAEHRFYTNGSKNKVNFLLLMLQSYQLQFQSNCIILYARANGQIMGTASYHLGSLAIIAYQLIKLHLAFHYLDIYLSCAEYTSHTCHTPQGLQSPPGSGTAEQLSQVNLHLYLAHLLLILGGGYNKEENQKERRLRASLALVGW